ncbi:MAG: anti-sigma factor antagonist [Desulfonauticus sp.]|jgi:anti-anti-sigma factor|nr:MAG: Anti-sigma-factor antagonist [Desulfonauticus sp. 38_4375]MDK2920563.1 anti-sigma factor antagonist [Desulfonauticus sp.]
MAEQEITLVMDGDIVASRAQEVKDLIAEKIAEGVDLTLDLSNVSYVDSIGIGIIIATHNSLKSSGGKLKIINASEDIQNLFKTMRLDKHIDIS